MAFGRSRQETKPDRARQTREALAALKAKRG
jgi:hypothetical protein